MSLLCFNMSQCDRCRSQVVWFQSKIVHPRTSSAPLAVADMPEDVKADYDEAAGVFELSPRSSAALLRLALQKLLKHLGEKGDNINRDIGNLVRKGLDPDVQMALDAIRVIGNNAVHPGQIDLNDDRGVAATLFRLINFVVEQMITRRKEIQDIYSLLPEPSRAAIAKRDGVIP